MPALSSPATWRAHPQVVQYYAYLDAPPVVFACRVNEPVLGDIEYPVTSVGIDGVTTGMLADCQRNMTVLFGTTAGADDLGRTRIRKVEPAASLFIQESSQGTRDGEVKIVDNAYITVLDDYRVWRVPPLSLGGGSSFVLDGGRTFADYGELKPNVRLNVGPAVGGKVNAGTGLLTVALVASATTAPESGASISAYEYTLPGAASVTAGAVDTHSVTFTVPAGRYRVTLAVDDDNGQETVRQLLVVAMPANWSTAVPLVKDQIRIKHATEGTTCELRAVSDIVRSTYPDGTLLILFREEYANGTLGSLAGCTGWTQIAFVGWHDTGDSSVEATSKGLIHETDMKFVGPAQRLAMLDDVSITYERENSPNRFGEIKGANIDRAILAHLQNYSTITNVTDVVVSGEGDSGAFPSSNVKGDSLYAQVDGLARRRRRRFTCTPWGTFMMPEHPLWLPTGDRTATVIVDVDETDWALVKMPEQRTPQVGVMTGSADIVQASDADAVTKIKRVYAIAPGAAQGQGTGTANENSLLLGTQVDLNETIGEMYAQKNAPFGGFAYRLAHMLDAGIYPCLLEPVRSTISADSAAQRGESFTDESFLPLEISITHDAETGTQDVQGAFERYTIGSAAASADPPQEYDNDLPVYTPPTFDFGVPVLPVLPPSPFIQRGDGTMAVFRTDNVLAITEDFSTPEASGGPLWTDYALSLTGNLVDAVLDAFSPGQLGTGTAINAYIVTDSDSDAAWYLEDVFGARTLTSLGWNPSASTSAAGRGRRIESNFGTSGHVVIVSNYFSDATYPGTWYTYSTDANDGTPTWAAEAQITAHYNTTAGANAMTGLALSSRSPGTGVVCAYSATGANTSSEADFHNLSSSFSVVSAAIATPANYDPGDVASRFIHIPFDRNTTEGIVWFNRTIYTGAGPGDVGYELRRKNGASVDADCGPTKGGYTLVGWNSKSFHSCPTNRARLIYAASNFDSSEVGVFVSVDEGDTWAEVSGGDTGDYHGAAIAGNDPNSLFVLGSNCAIGYSADFGATGIDSRKGNMATAGEIVRIIGG